jgi:hypothetical protein
MGGTYLNAFASSPVGIASVHFEVSGDEGLVSHKVVSSALPTPFGWFGAWDATDVPNGRYTLQSVATDPSGKSTTSTGIAVTVDNDRLRTTVCLPSNGASLAKSPALLDAWTVGKVDVTKVQYIVSGRSPFDDRGRRETSSGSLRGKVVATATQTGVGWMALWNITALPSGTYKLRSVATDRRGATATSDGVKVTVANSRIDGHTSEAAGGMRLESDLASSGCGHPSTDVDGRQDSRHHGQQSGDGRGRGRSRG